MCNANEQSHGCQPLAATAGQQSLWNELPGKKKIIQKPLLVVSLRLLFQNSHQNSLVLSLSSQVPFVPVEARAQQRMEATSRSFPRVDSSLRIFEAPKTPSPHATVQPIEMNASPGNRRIYIYIYIWSPPPHDPPTSILYGNYQCFMHFFFYQKNDILMFLFLLLTT